MDHPMGDGGRQIDFTRRLKLEFQGSRITSHAGLLRQAVFGRVAGHEDVNDADRLAHDPTGRAVVNRGGLDRLAASTSQLGRLQTG
jgi:hypothetical protein